MADTAFLVRGKGHPRWPIQSVGVRPRAARPRPVAGGRDRVIVAHVERRSTVPDAPGVGMAISCAWPGRGHLALRVEQAEGLHVDVPVSAAPAPSPSGRFRISTLSGKPRIVAPEH